MELSLFQGTGKKSVQLGPQHIAKGNYPEIQTQTHSREEVRCLAREGILKDEDASRGMRGGLKREPQIIQTLSGK